ncbi:MAG: hypothetical protein HY912_20270 [Desulfomonile tiedjei]|uniref:Leucine Rich Repeat (LRR)-containing protein n=1 Tax=Desulfomonile tiedjei TaxID=2358 RepID=A0A9D6Z5C9_9BACT|nr:hypothetical protein [Desulfomonile tiedjei]
MNNFRPGTRVIRGAEIPIDQREIIRALENLELIYVGLDESGNAASLRMRQHKIMTDDAMQLVVKLKTLTSLTLWPMTDKRLAYVKLLPNLEHTDFRNLSRGASADGEHVTDAGLIHLSELYDLVTLCLSGAQISDSGLNHLKGLTNLKKLQVGGPFTLAGLKQLSCISNLVYLEVPSSLGLGYAEFCPNLEEICHFENSTDSDLAYLQVLTKLRVLRIASDKVSDFGIRYLKSIKSLRELALFCPNVTESGIKELQEALPECDIEHDPSPLP